MVGDRFHRDDGQKFLGGLWVSFSEDHVSFIDLGKEDVAKWMAQMPSSVSSSPTCRDLRGLRGRGVCEGTFNWYTLNMEADQWSIRMFLRIA